MKKAKVTAFIIVGLIIIVIIAFVFNLSKFNYEIDVEQNTGFNSYMRICLDSQIEQGIYQMGLYSGYINKPTRFELSTIENSKEELKTYIEENIKTCSRIYPNNENIQITHNTPVIDIELVDQIIVKIKNSYNYKTENELVQSPDILYTYNVRYLTVYNTAIEIINDKANYILDSDKLKLNDLEIETGSIYDGELWLITDKKSKIKSGAFYFAFKIA